VLVRLRTGIAVVLEEKPGKRQQIQIASKAIFTILSLLILSPSLSHQKKKVEE